MTEKEYIFRELTRISRDIESLKNMVSKITYNGDYYDDPRCTTKVDTTRTSTFDKTETTGTSTNGWVSMCDH